MKKKLKTKVVKLGPGLISIALDLKAAIKNANWEGKLHHPTLHMEDACYKLDQWIEESGIPCLTYRQ